VTVEADPVDRARVALLVVLVGGGESSRQARGTEVEHIPLMDHMLELFAHFRAAQRLRFSTELKRNVLPRDHE
jgi:hypothetical protein